VSGQESVEACGGMEHERSMKEGQAGRRGGRGALLSIKNNLLRAERYRTGRP
jgi:hypothetical protein